MTVPALPGLLSRARSSRAIHSFTGHAGDAGVPWPRCPRFPGHSFIRSRGTARVGGDAGTPWPRCSSRVWSHSVYCPFSILFVMKIKLKHFSQSFRQRLFVIYYGSIMELGPHHLLFCVLQLQLFCHCLLCWV